jgi:RNA polymerase sigma factor (TIGR02999 family)
MNVEDGHGDLTHLLSQWGSGEGGALERLVPEVYGQLKRLAAAHFFGERAHTLQPTALVNEVYLRLVDAGPLVVNNRTHFLSLVSRMMRHILVDHAREKRAQKRGGLRVTLSENSAIADDVVSISMLDVDKALSSLESEQPDLVRVIEMRFFAGMTSAEMAEALGRTVPSIEHSLRIARMWLRRELGELA